MEQEHPLDESCILMTIQPIATVCMGSLQLNHTLYFWMYRQLAFIHFQIINIYKEFCVGG